MKKIQEQTGITLIALIITIIVMLILVGISISMAVNSGLFGYAGNAVGETQNSIKQENSLINDIIENYIKNNIIKEETPAPPTLTVISGTEGNNGWYTSDVTVEITPQNKINKTTYILSSSQDESEIEGTSVIITAEGTSTITAYSYNNTGDRSAPATITIKKDSIAPTFNVGVSASGEGGVCVGGSWSIYNVKEAEYESGVADNTTVSIYYSKNGNLESDYILYCTSSNLKGNFTDIPISATYVQAIATVEDLAGNSSTITDYTSTTCFLAGTKVLTEGGLKNIEEIQIGEKVYTINLETNEKELQEVIKLINGYSSEIYEITIGNSVIGTTPRHQFYVEGKGWVRACEIEEGEELTTFKAKEKKIVSSIKYIYYEEPVAVYNLTIENNHNYLITEYNFLVHNAPGAC